MELIPPTISDSDASRASKAVAELFPEVIHTLTDLVKIQGIAWEAFDARQLESSAEAVKNLFESTAAFDRVDILRSSYGEGLIGAPAVVATRASKNSRPTILLLSLIHI